jgi:hypothetical protein
MHTSSAGSANSIGATTAAATTAAATATAMTTTTMAATTAAGAAEAVGFGAARTLTSTATTLEVGLAHGAEGWVKVRAATGGDGIAASLSASSHAGESLLRAQLPALNAFLASEQIHAHAAVIASAAAGAAGSYTSASATHADSATMGQGERQFGAGTQGHGQGYEPDHRQDSRPDSRQGDGQSRTEAASTPRSSEVSEVSEIGEVSEVGEIGATPEIGAIPATAETSAGAAAALQKQEPSHTRVDSSASQLLFSPATANGGWLNVLA